MPATEEATEVEDSAEETKSARRRRLRAEKRQRALADSTHSARRRILRLAEVEVMTGLRHSTIYDAIAEGTFPPPVALTATARGWLESEVEDWLDQRIAERDAVTSR